MDIGKVTKIHKNVPEIIPVRIPKKSDSNGTGKEYGQPELTPPIRVPNWPTKVPQKVTVE